MNHPNFFRTLADVVVLFSYLSWPVSVFVVLVFGAEAETLITSLPLWGRAFIGIVLGLPAILIPPILWMYSMGKCDNLKTDKEKNMIYYTGAWLGEVVGFLYYWRYIRTGKDLEFFAPLSRILKINQGNRSK